MDEIYPIEPVQAENVPAPKKSGQAAKIIYALILAALVFGGWYAVTHLLNGPGSIVKKDQAVNSQMPAPLSSVSIQDEEADGAYETAIRQLEVSLQQGSADMVVQLASQSLLAQFPADKLNGEIMASVVPFFAGAKAVQNGQYVYPITDARGYKGLAYYKMLVNKDGQQKPYAFFLVRENGQVKVANIFINRSYQDLNNGQKP